MRNVEDNMRNDSDWYTSQIMWPPLLCSLQHATRGWRSGKLCIGDVPSTSSCHWRHCADNVNVPTTTKSSSCHCANNVDNDDVMVVVVLSCRSRCRHYTAVPLMSLLCCNINMPTACHADDVIVPMTTANNVVMPSILCPFIQTMLPVDIFPHYTFYTYFLHILHTVPQQLSTICIPHFTNIQIKRWLLVLTTYLHPCIIRQFLPISEF